MVEIPAGYTNITKAIQLRLDPKNKINIINAIVEFITNKNANEIKIYFDYFKIDFSECRNIDIDSLTHSLLLHENDNDIFNFYNYLFSNKITDYFHDKNAIEEVFKLEKYQDLKAYLDECFNCLQSGHKLAFLIIFRACTEFFLEEEIKNKNSQHKDSKERKIKIFIQEIDANKDYKILKPKINEIKKLFDLYREQGDHVAHCRVNEAKEFIENYCLESILKLFCIILENSIFKDDVLKINEDLKSEKLGSIDFNPQKIDNKINKKTIEKTNNIYEDDEIPF